MGLGILRWSFSERSASSNGRRRPAPARATAPPCIDDVKTYPVRVERDEIPLQLE